MPKKKTSLGRDPFDDANDAPRSNSVEKLIRGGARKSAGPKEVVVNVRLTPPNLKHLDRVLEQVAARGRNDVTRNDLIRIAITLLTADDV